MANRFVILTHRGTTICQEISFIGAFDDRKEAVEFLESKGFELDDDGYTPNLFVDRHSKELHWAQILDRKRDLVPRWVPLESEES